MQATQYQATYAPRAHTWGEYLSHRAGDWLRLLLLFVASIIILAPVLGTLSTSLRTPAESFTVPPQWITLRPDWTNYFEVFARVPAYGHAGSCHPHRVGLQHALERVLPSTDLPVDQRELHPPAGHRDAVRLSRHRQRFGGAGRRGAVPPSSPARVH